MVRLFPTSRRHLGPCPHCGWEIQKEAVKCPYCSQTLEASSEAKQVCWLCRIVAGVSGIILLVGLLLLILQAG